MLAAQNKIDPTLPELRQRVLDGLISEKLILAQAEEDSVVVSDEEVTDRLDKQIKMLIQNYGSEEQVEKIYKMSITKMKREFKDEIKKQLLTQKIRQMRESNISVSRREVEEFYIAFKDSLPTVPTEYELSHIYIATKPDTSSILASFKKAQSILDSLKQGADFGELAKRHSSDPGSAALDGDLGMVRRGMFVKEFEESVFTLRANETSKPVRTVFGYHIIQLLERKGDNVHPRHILFKIEQSPANQDSTIAKLNLIRTNAIGGESFASLAKNHSEDPETKDIGGDMGKMVTDQIEENLFSAIKNLKAGEISEPQKVTVGGQTGAQIILVRSVTAEHQMNVKDDYRRLENYALQQKADKKYNEWINNLKKSIYWELKD